jgi:hypothetical protein
MPAKFAANILHPPVGATVAADSPTGAAVLAGAAPAKAKWGTMLQVIRRMQHPPPGSGALMTIVGDPPAALDVERFNRLHAEAIAKEMAAKPVETEAVKVGNALENKPVPPTTTRQVGNNHGGKKRE